MVAKEKMAHIDVKHYSNMKRKDACDFFNAKPADKLKFTTLWDNTVSSWVCIIAESSKVMLLMWLKSSIESEKPGLLQFMGLQRVRHDLVTEQQ